MTSHCFSVFSIFYKSGFSKPANNCQKTRKLDNFFRSREKPDFRLEKLEKESKRKTLLIQNQLELVVGIRVTNRKQWRRHQQQERSQSSPQRRLAARNLERELSLTPLTSTKSSSRSIQTRESPSVACPL